MADRYIDQLKGFALGRDWDRDDEARLAALSTAGELLRESPDDEPLGLLGLVVESESELPLMRQAAYFARSRARPVATAINCHPPVDDQIVIGMSTQISC